MAPGWLPARKAKRHGHEAKNSRTLEILVRIGIVDYGLVHVLVAWIALQLAWSSSARAASSSGALHALGAQPLGGMLLTVVAVGLFALSGWQLIVAAVGHRHEEGAWLVIQRLNSVGRAVVYAVLGYSAAKTALGASSSSHDNQLTAQLLALPFGQAIVVVLGLVIVVVGGLIGFRGGVQQSFENDVRGRGNKDAGPVTMLLGRVGSLAKGVALGIVGALFVWAGVTYDPRKAGGLDQALRTLLDQPYGGWLLTLIGAGIACFGAYCFAWARYTHT